MRTIVGHAAACCGALVAWTEMSEVTGRFVFQGRPCQSTVKQHGWKGQRPTVADASQVGWTINIQCSNKYMDERRPQFVWSLQAKKECFAVFSSSPAFLACERTCFLSSQLRILRRMKTTVKPRRLFARSRQSRLMVRLRQTMTRIMTHLHGGFRIRESPA